MLEICMLLFRHFKGDSCVASSVSLFPDKPPEDEKHASKSEVNDNDNSGKSVVLGKAGIDDLSYLSSFCKLASLKQPS